MAGYMKKQNGHVYEGTYVAGEDLENGVFAEITSGCVKKLAEAGDMTMRVKEKDTLWGMNALVQDVVSEGTKEVYLVENEWDIRDNEDYDTAKYTLKKGAPVRMHRPLLGEEVIVTVDDAVYASLAEGDMVKPDAGGTVVKAA